EDKMHRGGESQRVGSPADEKGGCVMVPVDEQQLLLAKHLQERIHELGKSSEHQNKHRIADSACVEFFRSVADCLFDSFVVHRHEVFVAHCERTQSREIS
ncbi:hypothetical protein PENTCL1PPCAC_14841, partial [Pristionchus entomophagus]